MGKIVIKPIQRPDYKRPEEVINWFCAVFGLGGENEDNNLESSMLKEFINAAYRDMGITSSELNEKEHVPRSTVIYHLNRFMEVGLVVKKGRQYYLRATEMTKVMEEIEYDMEREMQKMIDTAKEFDKLMQKRMKTQK